MRRDRAAEGDGLLVYVKEVYENSIVDEFKDNSSSFAIFQEIRSVPAATSPKRHPPAPTSSDKHNSDGGNGNGNVNGAGAGNDVGTDLIR